MIGLLYRKQFRFVWVAICVFLIISVVVDICSSGTSDDESVFFYNLQDSTRRSSTTPRSSIGKVTMIYGLPEPGYERGLRLHKIHNERFGYPMFVLRSKTLPEYWSKPAYILKLLLAEMEKPESERLEWLFWVDSDIVLMNGLIPLEIFVPDDEDEHQKSINCLVTNDFHGLNNGAFFLRVHEWSIFLMSAVVATKVFRPDQELRFHDQTALELLLASEQFKNQTRHVPQRWFNAYCGNRGTPDPMPGIPLKRQHFSAGKEGDLLLHFPAHYPIRARRMNLWLDIAENHQPPWEVPLDQTDYIDEILEYWKDDVANEEASFVEADRQVKMAEERARNDRARREKARQEIQAQRALLEQQQRESELAVEEE